MQLTLGSTVPDFASVTDTNQAWTLGAVDTDFLVLYFYPKDDTPGCTKEACSFRDLWPDFQKLQATVVGVSRDSPASHRAFKEKYQLPITLLCDEDGKVCDLFNVIKEKKVMGIFSLGMERSTFLLDKNKTLIAEWRGVTVDGHSEAIMQVIEKHR